MTLQIIKTSDNSTTIYVPDLDETYHSIHGAIQESRHVFIKHGLVYWLEKYKKNHVKILEIGFGTGLNALLSLEEAVKLRINIDYTSLEPYPLSDEIVGQLNYSEFFQDEKKLKFFPMLHNAGWDQYEHICDHFRLNKRNTKLEDYNPKEDIFNIVFYDAFAPGKQPDMWILERIKKTTDLLSKGGVWITYSAKGQLKRDLSSLGLVVENPPGPPGKYEITRAIHS